ncbi:MAG: hypothetical protein WC208_14360 [Gallionella sp.]|jgi:hypothetical protein
MTTPAVTTPDTIATTTQSIIAEMKARYASAEASNQVPSMLELVALGVQMVDQRPQSPPLTGIQKMEIVKQAVAGIIDILPIPALSKAQLQAGLFLVENVAEVALSLLKANAMLATEVETAIKGCMPSWCCGDSSTGTPVVTATTTKPLNIPFPLIN